MSLIKEIDGITFQESKKIKEKSTILITAEEEYKKNPEIKKEDIQKLKDWIATQPHLPQNVSDEWLILFYHSCYYNTESTKNCIEVYYSLKTEAPEFFQDRDVSRQELIQALDVLHYGCPSIRSPEGYQIIYHKLRLFESSKYVFNDGVKLLFMSLEACLRVEGTCPGFIILFDMRGVKLGHLTRLSVSSLRKFFIFIQEGIPVRLKGIHVLNSHALIDKIMVLIKPFMKKELLSILHFYSEKDLEKIYRTLPKGCLFEDYGGHIQSVEKFHVNFKEWMNLMKPHFEEESRLKTDESKRVKKSSKKSSLSSSFKSLELD
ncbi:alpha-tocopherol transfer protein-like [Daktulosphaira vitifoliae]|uniref:alpha-tocopherol transfer protein-like n=1 Tax=Daktulosphaira vitifoliae TaxID=58002 RepID=UPI0021AB0726|nr:alpha-tocopherol transfer protein-like [Daktulosphaira vitifoliae]